MQICATLYGYERVARWAIILHTPVHNFFSWFVRTQKYTHIHIHVHTHAHSGYWHVSVSGKSSVIFWKDNMSRRNCPVTEVERYAETVTLRQLRRDSYAETVTPRQLRRDSYAESSHWGGSAELFCNSNVLINYQWPGDRDRDHVYAFLKFWMVFREAHTHLMCLDAPLSSQSLSFLQHLSGQC